jgi:GNAT superfamily N-acetyltransferase
MEFFTGWAGPDAVGRLWLNVDQPMAFVYDVEVREEQRRRGYGAGLMNAAAIWSREHGHPVLGLNVFAHNPGARALYDKLGYRVTNEYHTLDVADA